MFSSVQIKQEYPGVEDANQSCINGVPSSSDYTVFSNQDVEYMYRQLPQFWGQAQLQPHQISFELPSKSESLVRPELSQMGQTVPQFAVANYLQQHAMPFHVSPHQPGELNQAQTNQPNLSQQAQQNQLSSINPHLAIANQIVPLDQSSTPVKHNGPGRPPKSSPASGVAKKLKCQCEICFKEFGHKSNLFIHMRTHNGERPYKCTQCEKCFTHSGNLAIHMRTHSGERPYACQICGKMFSHSGNLSTHLRTHSGVKPYKCTVCAKEFRHSGNLSIHERIHSGIKPFQCKICGKEFYHSGNLTTHMKKHPVNTNSEQCENSSAIQGNASPSVIQVNSLPVVNQANSVQSANQVNSAQSENSINLIKSELTEEAVSDDPLSLTCPQS